MIILHLRIHPEGTLELVSKNIIVYFIDSHQIVVYSDLILDSQDVK